MMMFSSEDFCHETPSEVQILDMFTNDNLILPFQDIVWYKKLNN